MINLTAGRGGGHKSHTAGLLRTGIPVSNQLLNFVTSVRFLTNSSPQLFQFDSLSWAINYNHYSHNVQWGLQTLDTETPVLGSPGWQAVVVSNPHARLYKHTHAPTVDASWPTSLPAYFYVFICCAFHSQQLHSSSDRHVPSFFIITQSREAHNLSKTNVPRRPNLSPLLWQFITDSKLATSHYTHRHIHKSTDSTENK